MSTALRTVDLQHSDWWTAFLLLQDRCQAQFALKLHTAYCSLHAQDLCVVESSSSSSSGVVASVHRARHV
jgi:hypothetical protein